MDLSKVTDNLQKNVPKMVKDNKGALIGAVAGYFLTGNEQAKSMILAAIAGALIIDGKKKTDEDEE